MVGLFIQSKSVTATQREFWRQFNRQEAPSIYASSRAVRNDVYEIQNHNVGVILFPLQKTLHESCLLSTVQDNQEPTILRRFAYQTNFTLKFMFLSA